MSKDIRIEQIMTEKVIVANLNSKFSQIMDFFNQFNIQHLPVVENDRIIGIISSKDALYYLYRKLEHGESIDKAHLDADFDINKLMTANPTTVKPEAEIDEALEILAEKRFQALPVAENNIIKGIITNKDMVKAYYNERNPRAPHFDGSSTPGFGV